MRDFSRASVVIAGLLVRVVLRDLEKTLTNEAANSLRDRIYFAIHRGTEHELAHPASQLAGTA